MAKTELQNAWIALRAAGLSYSKIAKRIGVSAQTQVKWAAKFKDKIQAAKEKDLKLTIGVQFLLIEENMKDVEKAINLFSDIGVDYLSFKPYSLHPQMLNKKHVIYDLDVINNMYEIINKYKNQKMTINFRMNTIEQYIKGKIDFSHCCALPFWG